jgi:hypothetical protein
VGENTEQIERQIVAERHELGRNLNELETKAQQLGDWRTHYRNNPKVALGIALAGGLALGAMARRGRPSRFPDSAEGIARSPRPQTRLSRQIEDTWLTVSDALLGVAAAKVMAVVSSVVPGFSEQVNRSQLGSASNQRSSVR